MSKVGKIFMLDLVIDFHWKFLVSVKVFEIQKMVYAVAPTKWKLETKKILSNSAVVNSNASKSIKMGHRDDPLPSFHDQGWYLWSEITTGTTCTDSLHTMTA